MVSEETATIYKQVIDIIRRKPDLEELFYEIAKEFPEAIITASASVSFREEEKPMELPFDSEVLRIAKDSKIKAIKLVRGETKMGLKEAKDFVENLMRVEKLRHEVALMKSAATYEAWAAEELLKREG